jgi:hypothetical protein
MISQADVCDLLKRGVEYDRLMKREADANRQIVFRIMRDMWLELANETSMSAQELAREGAAIEQIQLRLKSAKTAHAA